MNIDIPPFYIGQEVVAIRDHSDKHFKKGDDFIIVDIYKSCCGWVVDVGIPYDTKRYFPAPLTRCTICAGEYKSKNGNHSYSPRNFYPKIQIGEFVSMKEVVSLETVGAN